MSCTPPAVVSQFEKRAFDTQLRIADKIAAFADSMNFVYIHTLLFALWMLVFEKSPWPTLALAVSLEAIFLSTFVMIGQNRQAPFQQAKADTDYKDVNTLLGGGHPPHSGHRSAHQGCPRTPHRGRGPDCRRTQQPVIAGCGTCRPRKRERSQ
jgi:hypothetical protein